MPRYPDTIREIHQPPANIEHGDVATWDATVKRWKPAAPASGEGGGPHALVGTSHTATGLTPGHVLRATGVGSFAFGALEDGDIPAGMARDSEVTGAVSAHEAAGDPHTGYQRESEKAQPNGYASLGADGKVPAAQLPASGGADPWTVVKLASPFSTTSTTPQAVTGLAFAPAAGKIYVVYGGLLLRASGAALTGPRPGINWPSGLTRQGALMFAPTSATAQVQRVWGPTTANQNAASTGLPDTSNCYLSTFEALIVVGASPSGNFQVTLCSETSGTAVELAAGSYLMYREI